MVDGPYCNKPDEGVYNNNAGGVLPYIGDPFAFGSTVGMQTSYFSPNRQVSSPVMFGSLLVGLGHPWRTLLFRPPNLSGYQVNTGYMHPGNNLSGATASSAVPDHLLLDLFRMPVVEPYAISDPLATAGQINLNTQIAPFTYITRTTGLRAVLKSVMITALPIKNFFITGYKRAIAPGTGTVDESAYQTRYPVDLDNTVALLNPSSPDTNSLGQTAFPEFTRSTHSYAAGSNPAPNFFVSASQICDLPLIPWLNATSTPTGPLSTIIGGSVNLNSLSSFWQYNQLTGDNSLERPYSLIYSRVTTRSNTFTIHVRAQTLQKVGANIEAPTTWTEGTDQVSGEYRGSYTVEKYFDPTSATITDSSGVVQKDLNDKNLPATAAVRGALWRLLYDKRFGQ